MVLDQAYEPDEVAIVALEHAAAAAWPAPISERLGDWLLRSAEGFTGRANSALPIGDPGMPVPAALDRVVAFYRALGRQPLVDVPLPISRTVEASAIAHGWSAVSTTLVQCADVPALVDATAGYGEVPHHDRPTDEHLDQIRGARGALPPAGLHVLTAVDTVTFAELREGGRLVARARASVTDGWLGLFGIATVEAARRRGLAAAVIGSVARWASSHGATRAFLQVEATNAAALPLYRKLGFTTHHSYTRYTPVSAEPVAVTGAV